MQGSPVGLEFLSIIILVLKVRLNKKVGHENSVIPERLKKKGGTKWKKIKKTYFAIFNVFFNNNND